MKAYRNADGYVDWFSFDTDNGYYTRDDGRNVYSKVTYSTDGSVAQITGPWQEPFTAHDSFDETFTYTVETCNTYSSRRRALWADIDEPVEESAVGLSMSYYDNNFDWSYEDRSQTYECSCEESQSYNSFAIFLQHFFAWLSSLFESMV